MLSCFLNTLQYAKGYNQKNVNGYLYPSRRDLLLIVFSGILADFPFYVFDYAFNHDLLFNLTYFKSIYSSILYDHILPFWTNSVFYGIKNDFIFFGGATPFAYVFGVIGYLFRVENSVLLYALSMTSERIFFAISLYFLGLLFFRSRLVATLIPVIGAATLFWFRTPIFNLHAISFVPLALFLLFRFAQTQTWSYLWLSGVSLALSMAFPLMAGVLALCFLTIIVVWFSRSCRFRTLISRPSLNSCSIFFICIALVLANRILFGNVLEELDLLAPARADDGKVSLRVFLSYGVKPTLDTVFQALILGYRPDADWTCYFGLLPILLVCTCITRVRRISAQAIIAGSLILILLTNASGAAALLFNFPTLEYYRHLQHLYPLLQVFLLILAGFGLDRIITAMDNSVAWRYWLKPGLVLTPLLLVVMVDIVAGPILRAADETTWSALSRGELLPDSGPVLAVQLAYLRGLVYGFCALLGLLVLRQQNLPKKTNRYILKSLLVAGLVFDIASYQWQAFQQWNFHPIGNTLIGSVLKAQPPQLAWQRKQEPMAGEQAELSAFFAQQASAFKSENYAEFETLAGIDRCYPNGRTHFMALGPARLIRLRGGVLAPRGKDSRIPWQDAALMKILGCEMPKFRLVANAVFADSAEERDNLIRQTSDLDRVVVFGPEGKFGLPPLATGHPSVEGNIDLLHFDENSLVLDVNNLAPYPVWLVYADAYDKGWQAMVNGETAVTREAYGAFKAVAVPPGSSRVEWQYHAAVSSWLILLMRLSAGWFGFIFVVCTLLFPTLVWRWFGLASPFSQQRT